MLLYLVGCDLQECWMSNFHYRDPVLQFEEFKDCYFSSYEWLPFKRYIKSTTYARAALLPLALEVL